jgi:hypothetical protein
MYAGKPLDQRSVERPAGHVSDPTVSWRGGLNEKVAEERRDVVSVVNCEVQVPRFDVDAPDGQGAAAIEPPPKAAALDPVEELFERPVPRHGPEARTLKKHLLQMPTEVHEDSLEVGRVDDCSGEGLASDR